MTDERYHQDGRVRQNRGGFQLMARIFRSCQIVQQISCRSEIGGRETFGKPIVD
jgi:hypothetical protein